MYEIDLPYLFEIRFWSYICICIYYKEKKRPLLILRSGFANIPQWSCLEMNLVQKTLVTYPLFCF